jgi:hypothetical protein
MLLPFLAWLMGYWMTVLVSELGLAAVVVPVGLGLAWVARWQPKRPTAVVFVPGPRHSTENATELVTAAQVRRDNVR